jgi:holo-[acyl-carrier protein] synthase
MIIGTGVDLVEIDRIAASFDRFGEAFYRKFLTERELAYCKTFSEPAAHVAARFAAKEALSKAVGTGFGAELGWLDIEVVRNEAGCPHLEVTGKGELLLKKRGITHLHLSLSHSRGHAVAMVIAERL